MLSLWSLCFPDQWKFIFRSLTVSFTEWKSKQPWLLHYIPTTTYCTSSVICMFIPLQLHKQTAYCREALTVSKMPSLVTVTDQHKQVAALCSSKPWKRAQLLVISLVNGLVNQEWKWPTLTPLNDRQVTVRRQASPQNVNQFGNRGQFYYQKHVSKVLVRMLTQSCWTKYQLMFRSHWQHEETLFSFLFMNYICASLVFRHISTRWKVLNQLQRSNTKTLLKAGRI